MARSARETLLGIDFTRNRCGRLEFVTASPLPDLIKGGELLIDVLAEVLQS